MTQENEELREAQLANNKHNSGRSGCDPSAPIHAELIAELQEQIDVLRYENNLLMEQRIVTMSELEGLQNEIERRTAETHKQNQELASAIADANTWSNRALQAERDRDAAAAQALSYSDALGKSQIEQEGILEQINILKQKCKDSDSLAMEYKKQLRSVSTKNDDESVSTYKRVHDAENRVRELHTLLLNSRQEAELAQDVNHKLRAEYQNTRKDAEGMLQVMAGLERQLNEYAQREAEVDRLSRSCVAREEEAITLREQVTNGNNTHCHLLILL